MSQKHGKPDYKKLSRDALARLKERRIYNILLDKDPETGASIILPLKHRRMSQDYYLKSGNLPTQIANAFALQFRDEDPQAFAKREELGKWLEEKDPTETMIEMIEFARGVLLETVDEPRIVEDGETDPENGVLALNDLSTEEIINYAMYQVTGAQAAPVSLSNGREVTMPDLVTFPEQERLAGGGTGGSESAAQP